MRVSVIAELKSRTQPHPKQIDLLLVSRAAGVQLVLVDEADRRYLRFSKMGEKLLRDLGTIFEISTCGNNGQVVDRHRYRPLHGLGIRRENEEQQDRDGK